MAVDEALIKCFDHKSLPIFRIYSWKPSISLGRFSKINNNINLNGVKEKNIDLSRRMSGGGILIHGNEISYSLSLPKTFIKNHGVKQNYKYLCSFLLKLYEKLSLKAYFACDINIKEKKSELCLAGTEAYDIVINNKKIGGNAQRHTSNLLFQHGTIPITLDETLFVDTFYAKNGLKNSTTLQKEGSNTSYMSLSELIKESFCETFNSELINESLSQKELELSQNLYKTKYSKKSWIEDGKENN